MPLIAILESQCCPGRGRLPGKAILQLVENKRPAGEIKELRREQNLTQMAGREVEELLSRVMAESGVPVLSARVKAANMETLREMADRLKNKLDSGIIILGAESDGKVLLVGAVTADLVSRGFNAGKLVGEIARLTGGGGGGRPIWLRRRQDPQRLDMALDKVYELVQAGCKTIKGKTSRTENIGGCSFGVGVK